MKIFSKLSKITLSFLVISASVSAFSGLKVNAADDIGPYSVWNSDSLSIGYFPTTNIKMIFGRTSGFGMDSTVFTTVGNYAPDAWSSLGITRSSGTTSDYTWKVQGITRAEATSYGFPSNVNAATTWNSYTKMGTASTPSGSREVDKITNSLTQLVWDTSSTYKTSNYSTDKWKAITAHEFGHALGYNGHDSTLNVLMYSSSSYYFDYYGIKTPQTRDINHMSNVY